MFTRAARGLICALAVVLCTSVWGQHVTSTISDEAAISFEKQHEKIKVGDESLLAFSFSMTKDWHFYASAETAPGAMNLKLDIKTTGALHVGDIVWPASKKYEDKSLGMTVDVYGGDFTIYVPVTVLPEAKSGDKIPFTVQVDGAVCSADMCRMPKFEPLSGIIEVGEMTSSPAFVLGAPQGDKTPAVPVADDGKYSLWLAMLLAFSAGLLLVVMPCVWPVLPIIVMRLVTNAKQNKLRAAQLGFAFCGGILLFFACLAGVNAVLQIFYNTVLQWGDQFRSPAFVGGMGMLLIVMAMFMFGLFSFTVPLNVSQDTEKKDQGSLAHSIGMGFFAAILSTPCSFGILAAVFGWAQGQTLFISTTVIMLIGVGMASPFFVLTLMPGLLSKLPRSGGWMERIKEGIGFLLLIIAVWLLLALPADLRANAFYYAVLLCLCVWIWGKWTKYGDKPLKRWSVRLFAVALAVVAGLYLFSSPEKKMNWQPYDAQAINKAVENHRPVLIKFTADWCLSCKVVEKLVYQDTELIELIEAKNVLAVKADTTLRDYEATLALKNIYNEPGVPVSILILADGTEKRWRGKGFADELKDLLSDL